MARTRRREDGFDGDARTNGPSDEVLHPGHKPVRVNGLRLKGLLTGEGQEAMREAGRARGPALGRVIYRSRWFKRPWASLAFISSRLPVIPVSRLLKSCAMPPVS